MIFLAGVNVNDVRRHPIPVSVIVGQIAKHATVQEILAEHPELEPADIDRALQYAAWLTQE